MFARAITEKVLLLNSVRYVDLSFSIHNIVGPIISGQVGGSERLVNTVVFLYVVVRTKNGPSWNMTSTVRTNDRTRNCSRSSPDHPLYHP